MKLTEDLFNLAQVAPEKHRLLLLAAVEKLEAQRLWRESWLRAENQVTLLTEELNLLRSRLPTRKEKECED